MKRTVLILMFAMMAMVYSQAQQIAVVTGNSTILCQTLADAIREATSGSTIYLPGGGFQISDDVKITKKVSIIGIGHKAVSENVEGNTVIIGNLNFNEGSSNSVVMGCYISGDVKIGYDEKSVNNILIKYCNLNSAQVQNNTCSGTLIQQNYIRNPSVFNYASVIITNNIMHSASFISGGIISNNIVIDYAPGSAIYAGLSTVNNATISYNVFIRGWYHHHGSDCVAINNMGNGDDYGFGDGFIDLGRVDWNNVFANFNNGAIDPASDFHFKGDYLQYSDCGIYGGTEPFSESSLPPVPYIVSQEIDEQTDASGKLNIKIRVKAGE